MFQYRAVAVSFVMVAVTLVVLRPAAASTSSGAAFAPYASPFRYLRTVQPSTMRLVSWSAPGHRVVPELDLRRGRPIFSLTGLPGYSSGDVPDIVTAFKFAGMSGDSAVCGGSCIGAGTDIATSRAWVVESVGFSVAVYSSKGALQGGWPKDYATFFGIPSPGQCDPSGPGLTYASLLYDPNDKRFFAFVGADEGQVLGDSCPDSDQLYAAVSTTNDPRGAWNIYVATGAPGDVFIIYPAAGITPRAVCVGLDARGQANFQFASAVFGCVNKRAFQLQGGMFDGFTTSLYDSLVPATVRGTTTTDPRAALFIASQNENDSMNCTIGPCNQYLLADIANPSSVSPTLSTLTIPSPVSYNPTPLFVHQPGQEGAVIEDMRMSPHPVLGGGELFFAHNTGVGKAGSTLRGGVLWAQASITFDPVTHGLMAASIAQAGIVKFPNDRSAVAGGITVDPSDDVVLAFDSMSSMLNPSMEAASRLVTDPPGVLGPPRKIMVGTLPTSAGAIVEQGAATIDDLNRLWIARSWSNGIWGTEIVRVKP